MGQTVTTDPTPRFLKKGQESVFDSPVTKVLRFLGQAIGADDPQSQILGMMNPMDVGAGGGLAGLVQKFIKAYHGSPHDFDQFSLSKIGTGEGAQAYGHGLYFAENEGVAKSYRDMLAIRKFKVGDRELIPTSARTTQALDGQSMAEKLAADTLDDAFNAQSSSPAQMAANRLRKQRHYYPEQAADIDAALQLIGDWQASGSATKPVGKMYEVNIHADPEQLLDWDKPLSEQSEKVRQALGFEARPTDAETEAVFEMARKRGVPASSLPEYKALERRLDRSIGSAANPDVTGAEYYRATDTPLFENGADPLAMSRYLRERGIPGIKYLDGGSRAAGEGSRNYVVWDDSIIEIARKYGWAMAAAIAKMNQQRQGEQ